MGERDGIAGQERGAAVMPRLAKIDQETLTGLLGKQFDVLTRGQALSCGITNRMMQNRLRAGGPWQVLLPAVYLTVTGTPTPAQRQMAAQLYGGPASVITGPAALFSHSVRVARTDVVDVLVPVTTQRKDREFVRLHRTARMPEQTYVLGEIRYAPVARAVADAARAMDDIGDVRAVVADSVQRGIVPVERLVDEVQQGPVRGSALLRQAVAEVTDGVRSSAEGELRDLIKQAKLPMPLFNAALYAGDQFIARPDCWWADAGVAVEVDSRQWHLSPKDWERTLARHAAMSAHGIVVLHFTPQQIKKEGATVTANLRSALETGRARPPLPIRTVPAS
jgi:very-short-patch-repair endonuclease